MMDKLTKLKCLIIFLAAPTRLLIVYTFISFLTPDFAWSSACCGGGASLPSIIGNDDKAFVGSTVSHAQTIQHIDSEGFWEAPDESEVTQTYKFDTAFIWSDRWQSGLSIPISSHHGHGKTQTNLGDIAGTIAFEALPEWNYHPIRPKGFVFAQLTAPTGKNEIEVGSQEASHNSGKGFWTLGIGTLLLKNYRYMDYLVQFEVHRSFDRYVDDTQYTGNIRPGWGSLIGFGLGYNIKHLRIGAQITNFYEDPIVTDFDSVSSTSAVQRYTNTSLSAAYSWTHEIITSLVYTDQAILGNPSNTELAQIWSFQIQKRWPR